MIAATEITPVAKTKMEEIESGRKKVSIMNKEVRKKAA